MLGRSIRILELDKILSRVEELASSHLAKKRIREIKPTDDPIEIEEQQRAVAEMVSIIFKAGRVPFGPLYDIKKELKMAEIGSSLGPRQLIDISDTLRTIRRLHYFIKELEDGEERYPMLYGQGMTIVPLKRIEDAINNAIISEMEISDNASSTLRSIRRAMDNKQDSIRRKLDSYISSSSTQRYLQDNLITIRNDRFVIPVKAEHRSSIKGMIHDQSSSGSTIYVEPMAIVELNNELNQLKIDEQKEIERILAELTGLVGEVTNEIRMGMVIAIELDFIHAKAAYAHEINGVRPEIAKDWTIKIVKGRHPLLDQKTVVPLSIHVGDDYQSLIITGPNTGGKTVTLKTVGLLVLMHQSGLHVPASHGTMLPIYEHVYADIGDEQSIEQSLSTFSSHMTNIVSILDQADIKSLVLLDELGAGTDPVEGAALAMSILTKLYERGVTTIATTHYSELKHYALSTPGFENASVEFNVETLSPTYRLIIGIPGKSNAFEISQKLGLSEEVITRARHLVDHQNIEFESILEKIEDNRIASEKELAEASRMKKEAEALAKKYEAKLEKFEQKRDTSVSDAKREAKKILAEAKRKSDELIKELQQMTSNSADNKRIEAIRKDFKDELGKVADSDGIKRVKSKAAPKTLKEGDRVKVLSFDQTGDVLTTPDKDGYFMCQVGIMKMKLHLSDVVKDNSIKKQEDQLIRRMSVKKKATIKKEIDIRGLNVEEAMVEVDKYLDDAFLSNLTHVEIIHGKGTGALRAGIKDYLKHHRHVKSQRDGSYQEGGTGVTVVELK